MFDFNGDSEKNMKFVVTSWERKVLKDHVAMHIPLTDKLRSCIRYKDTIHFLGHY